MLDAVRFYSVHGSQGGSLGYGEPCTIQLNMYTTIEYLVLYLAIKVDLLPYTEYTSVKIIISFDSRFFDTAHGRSVI